MDSPPRGFRSFVPRYYATSRNFRQQNAVKRGCKSLLSGEGLGKGRAVYGRLRPILEGGFRRAAEIPAFGPKTALSGPNAPRRPLDGGGGRGTPRRPAWAATGRDFAGNGGPPRQARAHNEALAQRRAGGGWGSQARQFGRPARAGRDPANRAGHGLLLSGSGRRQKNEERGKHGVAEFLEEKPVCAPSLLSGTDKPSKITD